MALAFLFVLIETHTVYSQRTQSSLSAGNQRRSEKSLKDHQYFFYFIDPTVTNSGDDEERALLIEATRRDLIARMLYMRFEFNPAMNEVIRTQKLLITLYSKIAVREVDAATALLNEVSTEILKTKDDHSKHYISLGYRSVDLARKTMIMTDNIDETNYSIKIYEYVKAIKSAKYSKRYAIIGLIDNRMPLEKSMKIDYNNYDVVKDLIAQYIPENAERYKAIHFDNFYKFDQDKSIFNSVRNHPKLEKIPEYKDYLKGHR